MVHTGRDCFCDVDRVFSGRIGLPDVKCNLDCGSRVREAWGADREDDGGY